MYVYWEKIEDKYNGGDPNPAGYVYIWFAVFSVFRAFRSSNVFDNLVRLQTQFILLTNTTFETQI